MLKHKFAIQTKNADLQQTFAQQDKTKQNKTKQNKQTKATFCKTTN
jgi:hypothetical protein